MIHIGPLHIATAATLGDDAGMIGAFHHYAAVSAEVVVNVHPPLGVVRRGDFSIRPLGNRAAIPGLDGGLVLRGHRTFSAGGTRRTPSEGGTGRALSTAGGGKGTTGSTFGRGTTGSTGGKSTMTPKNQTTVQTRNGGSVTKRPDGKVATLHDPKRGMDVHHNLSGNRRVVVERSDHSRIVAERGGRGYVQRPYMYHGHEYARRSYYYRGRYYDTYYGRCAYHGVWVNPYYPAYYYGPAYYSWVSYPWGTAAPYAWGWNVNPWYGYYGAFFTPYTVYPSASFWLTDYIIATSLQSAYQAQAAALSNPAPLTPEVKDLIADEVRQQIALENNEARIAAKNGEPDAASSSIQRLLTDASS